jgi:hypothetical protein
MKSYIAAGSTPFMAAAAAAAAAVTSHRQVVRSMPLLESLSLAAAAPHRAHEVGSSTQQKP